MRTISRWFRTAIEVIRGSPNDKGPIAARDDDTYSSHFEECRQIRDIATSGRIDEATERVRELARRHPNSTLIRVTEINLIWFNGLHEEAYAESLLAMEKFPTSPEVLALCGQFAQSLGHHQTLVYTCERLIALGHDDVTVRCAMGSAHLSLGATNDAGNCFEAALALEPDHAVALQNLAYVRACYGLLADAISLLNRAIDLDPGLTEAYLNLAIAYRRQKDLHSAISAARRALDLDQNNSRVLAELSCCFGDGCQWSDLSSVRNQLERCTLEELDQGQRTGIAPLMAISLGLTPAVQLKVARAFFNGN